MKNGRNGRLTIPVPAKSNGWVRVRLRDLCREDRCLVEPATALAASLPYLGLEHVEADTGRILLDPSRIDATAGQSMTFRFDPRHVLYGKLRPYLNKVALPSFEGRCTTELIPLLPSESACRELVALLLRRPQTVAAAMTGVTGARMPRANLGEVLAQEVIIPAEKEQQEALASSVNGRLVEVHRARTLCEEQLELLRMYERRLVEDLETAVTNSGAGHERE